MGSKLRVYCKIADLRKKDNRPKLAVSVSQQKRPQIKKGIEPLEQIKYLNLNIFRTRCCKPLIFQTQII